jgi:hypothetical protein
MQSKRALKSFEDTRVIEEQKHVHELVLPVLRLLCSLWPLPLPHNWLLAVATYCSCSSSCCSFKSFASWLWRSIDVLITPSRFRSLTLLALAPSSTFPSAFPTTSFAHTARSALQSLCAVLPPMQLGFRFQNALAPANCCTARPLIHML